MHAHTSALSAAGEARMLTPRQDSSQGATSSKLHAAARRINYPGQLQARRSAYTVALATAGRVGWCGKAVVYAAIGGLACQSAVGGDRPDPGLPTTQQVSASPQGAFVLLGRAPGGVSIVLLLVMMVALAAYATWRFWEGLAGQGYDASFSGRKNFFKFRLSPIVSGAVYVSYLVFLVTLLDSEVRYTSKPAREGWPSSWRYSVGGRVGLAVLGVAFCIATAIQLQGVLKSAWHRDYREDLPRRLMLAVFAIGHVGFAGRAGAFLAMGILFFKDAGGAEGVDHSGSMVANALTQLQGNRGLRAVLMLVGLLLIVYGLFAVLSAATRHFPTQPPSRRKAHSAAESGEDQQQPEGAKEEEEQQQQQHNGNTRARRWPASLLPRSQAGRGATGRGQPESGGTTAPPPAGDVALVVCSRRDQQQVKAQQLPVSVCVLPQEAAAAGAAEFVSIDLQ